MSERYACNECGVKCFPENFECSSCNDTLCGACCEQNADDLT